MFLIKTINKKNEFVLENFVILIWHVMEISKSIKITKWKKERKLFRNIKKRIKMTKAQFF